MKNLEHVYVIGMGEVGRRLAAALERSGVDVLPVTRSSGWDRAADDPSGLRLLCVREESLDGVLSSLGGVPANQLITVQNGWIRSLVPEPSDAVTRGLIWFTSKGDFFSVLRPSPFTGPWAEPLAGALSEGGIPSTAVDSGVFDLLEADKMGFNCVVGLPLAVHGVTLGDYIGRHRDEARALFTESASVCATSVGVAACDDWWQGFLTSVEPLGWVQTKRAKALEFRNGAVLRLARELDVPAPVNERLLDAHERLA